MKTVISLKDPVKELAAASLLALQYLEHPDVQKIPSSYPAAAVAIRLKYALADPQLKKAYRIKKGIPEGMGIVR